MLRAPACPEPFAVVFDDLAGGLRAFGELVAAAYGVQHAGRIEEAIDRTDDAVAETRAVLSELMTLDVDSRATNQWMLRGSVLSAVDQVLHQLDLDQVGAGG